MKAYDVVVIGAGVSGISAMIWLKQLGLKACMVEKKEELGGQLHLIHNKIMDYPGLFQLTGKELLEHFQHHVEHLQVDWQTNSLVSQIQIKENEIQLTVQKTAGHQATSKQDTEHIQAKYLIVATGASQKKLNIPGEEQLNNKGALSTSKNPDYFSDKKVVIIGGGDRALEGAYRLEHYASSIMVVHRHSHFKAKEEFLEPIQKSKKVNLKTHHLLEEIIWNEHEQLSAVKLYNLQTKNRELHPAEAVLIRIGIKPNHELIAPFVQMEQGMVLRDYHGQTSERKIFAIGDMVTPPQYSSISNCIGEGMKAAKCIWQQLQQDKLGKKGYTSKQ